MATIVQVRVKFKKNKNKKNNKRGVQWYSACAKGKGKATILKLGRMPKNRAIKQCKRLCEPMRKCWGFELKQGKGKRWACDFFMAKKFRKQPKAASAGRLCYAKRKSAGDAMKLMKGAGGCAVKGGLRKVAFMGRSVAQILCRSSCLATPACKAITVNTKKSKPAKCIMHIGNVRSFDVDKKKSKKCFVVPARMKAAQEKAEKKESNKMARKAAFIARWEAMKNARFAQKLAFAKERTEASARENKQRVELDAATAERQRAELAYTAQVAQLKQTLNAERETAAAAMEAANAEKIKLEDAFTQAQLEAADASDKSAAEKQAADAKVNALNEQLEATNEKYTKLQSSNDALTKKYSDEKILLEKQRDDAESLLKEKREALIASKLEADEAQRKIASIKKINENLDAQLKAKTIDEEKAVKLAALALEGAPGVCVVGSKATVRTPKAVLTYVTRRECNEDLDCAGMSNMNGQPTPMWCYPDAEFGTTHPSIYEGKWSTPEGRVGEGDRCGEMTSASNSLLLKQQQQCNVNQLFSERNQTCVTYLKDDGTVQDPLTCSDVRALKNCKKEFFGYHCAQTCNMAEKGGCSHSPSCAVSNDHTAPCQSNVCPLGGPFACKITTLQDAWGEEKTQGSNIWGSGDHEWQLGTGKVQCQRFCLIDKDANDNASSVLYNTVSGTPMSQSFKSIVCQCKKCDADKEDRVWDRKEKRFICRPKLGLLEELDSKLTQTPLSNWDYNGKRTLLQTDTGYDVSKGATCLQMANAGLCTSLSVKGACHVSCGGTYGKYDERNCQAGEVYSDIGACVTQPSQSELPLETSENNRNFRSCKQAAEFDPPKRCALPWMKKHCAYTCKPFLDAQQADETQAAQVEEIATTQAKEMATTQTDKIATTQTEDTLQETVNNNAGTMIQ